ncbi:hypothetical protein [Haloplanus halobius]|uniref:hypothetical protein n=1 Tax=Haloplanus halobius TaxID=2934938 RepID=UPI0020105906|nr:hypothetical protein [Haloplanus sp. XH21]
MLRYQPSLADDRVHKSILPTTSWWSISLPRDTLLFGIALIMFGNWVAVDGLQGVQFATAGLALAAIAFLASVLVTIRAQ